MFAQIVGFLILFDDRGNLLAEFGRSPAQMRFQNLTDVHTRRHTERIENNLHRSSIGQIRHVFFRKNARDHALVAVTAGHLVADRQLALHRDVHLDHLDDARRKLIALLQLGNASRW
jgi:hypothetical protein